MYADNAHVDGEVLQGTLNVIGHLSMTPEKRLEVELQVQEKIDDPIFDPTDTTWAEEILDADEPRDQKFKVPVKRPRESSSKGKQRAIIEDTEKHLEPPRYSKSDSRLVTPRMVKPPPSLRRTVSEIYMTERASATARDDSKIEKMSKIY
ncbi:hypothetical protein Taro_037881, partial [Colocasia esculenta]|nr:hypothetical protein [Colocasia esculenta]